MTMELTVELGLLMNFTKVCEALVVERMVSVRPNLKNLVAPLSYVAVAFW